jgi:hypothetical protein
MKIGEKRNGSAWLTCFATTRSSFVLVYQFKEPAATGQCVMNERIPGGNY